MRAAPRQLAAQNRPGSTNGPLWSQRPLEPDVAIILERCRVILEPGPWNLQFAGLSPRCGPVVQIVTQIGASGPLGPDLDPGISNLPASLPDAAL